MGKYSEVNQTDDGRSKFEKKKKTPRETMRSLGLFIYNPRNKTVLDRSGKSWLKIIAFYLVFYIILAGFFAAMLYGFFTVVPDNEPRLQDWDSLIKYNPGMGYRPQPDIVYTLIDFEQGELSTYKDFTESLDTFLENYSEKNQTDRGLVDCGSSSRAPSVACKFPLSKLGSECTSAKKYGYDEGKPCVLLKMNKLFNWAPEPYNGNETNSGETPPEQEEGFLKVTCEGVTAADKDNIGPMKFYPSGGFDASYFPYKNQKGYLAPLVMVQFERLRPGTLVQVWCKVWAANIYHDSNDRAGSVRFEILQE